MFLATTDIYLIVSRHVECVFQLVRKCAENSGIAGKKEAGHGDGRKIHYREEEIPDCGCIYG